MTPCLKTSIQVAQNDCKANAHHHSVQKRPFGAVFKTIVLEVHDDRWCIKCAAFFLHMVVGEVEPDNLFVENDTMEAEPLFLIGLLPPLSKEHGKEEAGIGTLYTHPPGVVLTAFTREDAV